MEDNRPIDVDPSKFIELKSELNLAEDLKALFGGSQGNAMEAFLESKSEVSVKQ